LVNSYQTGKNEDGLGDGNKGQGKQTEEGAARRFDHDCTNWGKSGNESTGGKEELKGEEYAIMYQ